MYIDCAKMTPQIHKFHCIHLFILAKESFPILPQISPISLLISPLFFNEDFLIFKTENV